MSRLLRRGPLAALALVGALAFGGAARADDLLTAGKGAYKQFCSHCHGIDMINPGTSSYDLRRYPKDRKTEFLKVLHEGKGAMPAWGDVLTADEMEALWHYVATRAGKEPPEDAAAAPAKNGVDVAAAANASPEAAIDRPEPAAAPPTVRPGTLSVCMAKNGGPMSARRARGGAGLDYRLAETIAKDAGLDLHVAWFEAEQEEESTPVREAYALLAHGVCDLVPSFALQRHALEGLAGTRAALPRWDDRPTWLEQSFQVDLAPVTPTRPYLRVGLGLVAREDAGLEQVRRLGDLSNARLGIAQGTVGGVLLLRQGPRDAARDAVTLNPGPQFLWRMEGGAFDATLVSVAAYDMHRQQNPLTTLRLLRYRHPIGFNIAMVAAEPAVAALADRTIERLGEEGLRQLAEASGVTWDAPREPHVMAPLTMRDIVAERTQ